MRRPLKILVAGYFIGFPLGGQVWLMLHYVLGLARLGHEVLFLEDTGDWSYPFDPIKRQYGLDSSFGRALLEDLFGRYGLTGRWAYNSILEKRLYGLSQDELDRFCKQADLFLNLSGVSPLRENYMRCRTKAVIDTDPVFTQVRVADDPPTRAYFQAHDACFTFGCNLGAGATRVPLSGIDWKPTVPPVLLDQWTPEATARPAYTTVGSWDSKGRDIVFEGQPLPWRKSVKYRAIIDMPQHLPEVGLELTFTGMEDDGPRFEAHGWRVQDALELSRDPWRYRDYIRHSAGEFTVAKEQNVRLKSGWFSDRSACYLAAGRPVITEDTGFGSYLPVGEGLFAFHTMEEAVQMIRQVEAAPERHRQAARRIAEAHFDSARVLSDLLRALELA